MDCKIETAYWWLECCSSVPYFSKHVTAGHTEKLVTLGHFLKICTQECQTLGLAKGGGACSLLV